MQYPVFDHYTIKVNNLDESAEFYQQILGLSEITNRTKKSHIRWFSLGTGELHLVQGNADNVITNIGVHLAIRMQDLKSFQVHLEKNNITIHNSKGKPGEITKRADGIKQLYFKDPDGYWIEVNDAGA
jgi:catechol 2,3-dioxygenase-like lactoylglutathione lyase family enzyme